MSLAPSRMRHDSQMGVNTGEEWAESVWEVRVTKALLMNSSERKGRGKSSRGEEVMKQWIKS